MWRERVGVKKSIKFVRYPCGVNAWVDVDAEEKMQFAFLVANKMRSQLEELALNPQKAGQAFVIAKQGCVSDVMLSCAIVDVIQRITRISGGVVKRRDAPSGTLSAVVSADCMIGFSVQDVDLTKYVQKREKELAAGRQQLENIAKKVAAPGWREAKEAVQLETEKKRAETEQKIEELEKILANVKAATGGGGA